MFGAHKRNRRKPEPAGRKLSFEKLFALLHAGAKSALGVIALLVGVAVMLWGLRLSLDRPIASVEVGGNFQRIAPVEIEGMVAPFRGAGFLSIDLDALRAAVETIPWVDRARVERRWPNGVRILITEHVPAARWGDDGLMNTRGELFLRNVRHMPPELPQLIGPRGTEEQVAKLYLQTYPRLLAVGISLARVSLDTRGAWELTLGNGVQVRLGRQDVATRIDRLINVASPVLAARGAQVAYVDLRYGSGFAIGSNAPARVAEVKRPDA
jgi:cell division protein FtsQ